MILICHPRVSIVTDMLLAMFSIVLTWKFNCLKKYFKIFKIIDLGRIISIGRIVFLKIERKINYFLIKITLDSSGS